MLDTSHSKLFWLFHIYAPVLAEWARGIYHRVATYIIPSIASSEVT